MIFSFFIQQQDTNCVRVTIDYKPGDAGTYLGTYSEVQKFHGLKVLKSIIQSLFAYHGGILLKINIKRCLKITHIFSENEMVGKHHWYNGREFGQALGDREEQGSLVCCSSWGCWVRHDLVTEQHHILSSAMWHLLREIFDLAIESLSKAKRLKNTRGWLQRRKHFKWKINIKMRTEFQWYF